MIKKNKHHFKLTLLFIFFFQNISYAATHSGTISKMRGQVDILSEGSLSLKGPGPHIKYNNIFYTITNAALGKKIKLGQVVRTGNRSLARIIFDNGDQFMLGPGTEYTLTLPQKKSPNSIINLTRGKLRAIISKDGPRNNMKVKTRNASMGVRGTDFFVNARGFDRSEVSVLRGKVSLKMDQKKEVKKQNSKEKEVILETGYSAKIVSPPKMEEQIRKDKKEISTLAIKNIRETIIEIKKTSKQKLVAIHKSSIIKSPATKQVLTKKIINKIKQLEKKAIQSTLQDIKIYTPNLYKKMVKEVIKDTDDLNTKVVLEAHKKAPKESKPDLDDLENDDLSEDAYQKYFQQDD